jgi:ABC-type uncharacterized transport system substrate-binding protein
MRLLERRQLLIAFGAILVAPGAAFAQPEKMRRIGILSPDSPDARAAQLLRRDFVAALRQLGFDEGRNLQIEWRSANARAEVLPALARELVGLDVELIVARTNGPILAAKEATRTIPIVMFNGNFPVENGLIRSLARPGGNITGTSYVSLEFFGKHLEVLKNLAPAVIRVAILWDRNWSRESGTGKMAADQIERAAKTLGMTPLYIDVAAPQEIRSALDRIAGSRVDALHSMGAPVLRQNQKEITAFALNNRLASLGISSFAEDGGLADYSPDDQSYIDRTATYVDRILRGAKPADLPVEEPMKYHLVINLKTAKAIGLSIPQSALLLASRLIE